MEGSHENAEDENQIVTPWEVAAKEGGRIDYDKLIVKFGCQKLDQSIVQRVEKLTGKPAHIFLRRGVFFAHRSDDAIRLLEEIVDVNEGRLGTVHPDVEEDRQRLEELLNETGRARSRKTNSLHDLLLCSSRAQSSRFQVNVIVSAMQNNCDTEIVYKALLKAKALPIQTSALGCKSPG